MNTIVETTVDRKLTTADTVLVSQVELIMRMARDGHLSASARANIATNLHALVRVSDCLQFYLHCYESAEDLVWNVKNLSAQELEDKLSKQLARTGNGTMTIRGLCRTLAFLFKT